MDLIESDEEGRFIIDGPTLVKTLLLTLFGIAAALTITKFVSYLIYKCYVKCCKNKCCCKEKKGKNSDKNQNQQVLSRRGSRRSLHTLHQTPLVLRADLRKKSLNPSTFIQIQPEENISTEHIFDPMEMEKENDGDEYVLLSPNFVMSGGPTKKPSLIEYFTK